jgi:hypothetical protein
MSLNKSWQYHPSGFALHYNIIPDILLKIGVEGTLFVKHYCLSSESEQAGVLQFDSKANSIVTKETRFNFSRPYAISASS